MSVTFKTLLSEKLLDLISKKAGYGIPTIQAINVYDIYMRQMALLSGVEYTLF